MPIDRKIKLNEGPDNHELCCPVCRSENIHQGVVSVFSRASEKDGVKVDTDLTTHPVFKDRNPSSQREGLLIKFWCEGCDSEPELAIYQHKGYTLINWNSIRMELK